MPYSAEGDGEGPEGVGLHDVGSGLEVLAVHPAYQLRSRVHQDVGTALELRATEVILGEVLFLQPGARGAVEHHDLSGNQIQV